MESISGLILDRHSISGQKITAHQMAATVDLLMFWLIEIKINTNGTFLITSGHDGSSRIGLCIKDTGDVLLLCH